MRQTFWESCLSIRRNMTSFLRSEPLMTSSICDVTNDPSRAINLVIIVDPGPCEQKKHSYRIIQRIHSFLWCCFVSSTQTHSVYLHHIFLTSPFLLLLLLCVWCSPPLVVVVVVVVAVVGVRWPLWITPWGSPGCYWVGFYIVVVVLAAVVLYST